MEFKQSNFPQQPEGTLSEAYNTVHKYDFICISEIYFDSLVESEDYDLRINGCKLIRMNHPLNTKRGVVFMYYKESLVVKMIDKSYISNGKTAFDYEKLHDIGSEISQVISKRKKEYYDQLSKILNDPLTSSKIYWSILKTFYSGTKIPLIPPIIIDNRVITNFREKADFFNNFFASQCTPIVYDSILPSTNMYRTENKLSTTEDDKVT